MSKELPSLVITGSTGFLGRHFIDSDFARLHDIYRVVRVERFEQLTSSEQKSKRYIQSSASVNEIMDFFGLIQGPINIIHLATQFSSQHLPCNVQPMLDTNVALPTKLAEALAQTRKDGLFLNISTLFQRFEGQEYSPISLYASTKEAILRILDFYAQSKQMSVVDLTVGDMYGFGDVRPKLIPYLVRALINEEVVTVGSGTQVLSLLHVKDAVRALIAAIELGRLENQNSVIRVGTVPLRYLTVKELIELMQVISSRKFNIEFDESRDRPREIYGPILNLFGVPGYSEGISIEEGLRDLFLNELE
jgi:CDP-3, 6-dideoxy-D-glycero-L-glycero-4-hexulose-4-reductase